MNIEEAFFVARENMTSVYQLEEITDLAETAFRHFMNQDEGIIYIQNCEGDVLGVLSIGDLIRFYKRKDGEIKINSQYTALSSIDYDAAQKFFQQAYPVNEVPIVTADNKLLGIIGYKKNSILQRQQRKSLKDAKAGKEIWMKKEIFRFVDQTKARVIIYTQHELPLSREENELLRRRHYYPKGKGIKWNGLSDEEWKTFWQSE